MKMRDQIELQLKKLNSVHLSIEDESHQHSRGLETHFKVVLVSQVFEGLSRIQRSRLIHQELNNELQKIHSLTTRLLTPQEWQLDSTVPQSPKCQNSK